MTARQASPQAQAAIDRFIRFYAELIKAKQMACALGNAPEAPPEKNSSDSTKAVENKPEKTHADDTAPTTPENAAPTSATEIFLRLRIAICPGGTPPPSTDGYPDIGYVMAAMADEAMLHQTRWSGSQQWLHMLLEESLYGCRISGERLFELATRIIDGQIVGRDDLAATILLAISLDFRGRWRGVNDNGIIEKLRDKLYENVYNQPAPDQLQWHSTLADTLKPVLDKGKLVRLPRIWPWIGAIVAVLLISTVLSGMIWWYQTSDVLQTAHQIQIKGLEISREVGP